MKSIKEICFDPRVAVAELASASYPVAGAPENEIARALLRLARELGWSDGRGPFGGIIPRGARVLIKPNLVLDRNQGRWGMEPLITHPSLIRVVAEAALMADPSEVLVGDAPIQSCDFNRLTEVTELDRWAEELMNRDSRFRGVRDFRRTTCNIENGVRIASEDRQSEDGFALMDLAENSLLEPITDDSDSFRVTCYDPRLMAKTHSSGRHQYLVARDVLDSDVIINLPKLKTHKKAGVTCALKNLIGINGNKEYLPHHRVGGAETGGDCYPGGSRVKRLLEYSLDRQNMAGSFPEAKLWSELATNLNRVLRLKGDSYGTEGSWSGNDTIWRTCLDLNRILLYGRPDRTLGDEPQRRVIHLVDAVIAGQGEGPLSPEPLEMKLLFAGQNAVAVDWVGAMLLGYDPERIPIVRNGFGDFRWPLTDFAPGDVRVEGALGSGIASDVLAQYDPCKEINHPLGWRDAARARGLAQRA
jgi:uncharacterized protein (DUF362 family)